MNPYAFFIEFLFGMVGMGYIIYGRKSGNMIALGCGLALGVFPYFVEGIWVIVLIGGALAALPFLIKP